MKKARILCIDERDMTELIKLELDPKQFEFSALDPGVKSIDEVKTQNPDLILLEPAWEEGDGIALLKALKENIQTKNIPVIVVSAKSFDDEFQDALDAGASDYIVKPFYGPLLVRRIENVLSAANVQ